MNIDTSGYEDHPGLSHRTAEIIELLSCIWYDDSGPAHIVIGDYNLEDDAVRWCIRVCEEGDDEYGTFSNFSVGHPAIKATATLLRCLLDIPEAERIPRAYREDA